MADRREGVIVSKCFHCVVQQMTRQLLDAKRLDQAEAVAKLIQVVAELVEVMPPEEREKMSQAAVVHFAYCRKTLRREIESGSSVVH